MVQDVGYDNLLINFRGGPIHTRSAKPAILEETTPFRSQFPARYYLNDFELGLSFDANSDPSSRTITGFPSTITGRRGSYGRPLAPEMLKQGVRYCPFRLDVWQVGTMMKRDYMFEVRSLVFCACLVAWWRRSRAPGN